MDEVFGAVGRYFGCIDTNICQKRPIDMGASDEGCTDMDEALGMP